MLGIEGSESLSIEKSPLIGWLQILGVQFGSIHRESAYKTLGLVFASIPH